MGSNNEMGSISEGCSFVPLTKLQVSFNRLPFTGSLKGCRSRTNAPIAWGRGMQYKPLQVWSHKWKRRNFSVQSTSKVRIAAARAWIFRPYRPSWDSSNLNLSFVTKLCVTDQSYITWGVSTFALESKILPGRTQLNPKTSLFKLSHLSPFIMSAEESQSAIISIVRHEPFLYLRSMWKLC